MKTFIKINLSTTYMNSMHFYVTNYIDRLNNDYLVFEYRKQWTNIAYSYVCVVRFIFFYIVRNNVVSVVHLFIIDH